MIQTFCSHCKQATSHQETTIEEFFRRMGKNGLRENYPDIYKKPIYGRLGLGALSAAIDDETLLKLCNNPLVVYECDQCGHFFVTFQGG